MPMFGPGEGKDYSAVPPTSQTQKTPGKQQAACQRAGTSSVVDWSLNSNILEGGWPLPTITPPGDPMADSMASYNFMSPVPHSHPGFYSCSAPQTGSRQGQGQSYSAHSAANIPVSGYSSSTMVMAKSGATQPFPPSGVCLLYHPQHGILALYLLSHGCALLKYSLNQKIASESMHCFSEFVQIFIKFSNTLVSLINAPFGAKKEGLSRS